MLAPDSYAMWSEGDMITFESCWPHGSNTNHNAPAIAIL